MARVASATAASKLPRCAWAGFEQEAVRLQAEIGRLQRVVGLAIGALERLGAESEARRIDRAFDGR